MATRTPGASRRTNYLQALGQQRAREIIESKRRAARVDNFTGCWLYQGSTNNDGYGQVWAKANHNLHLTGRSAQSAFLIHIVSFVAQHGRDVTPGRHVSHRCDNRRCFNPEHLMDESAQVNNSRKGCAGPIACSVHGHIIIDLCSHIPRCIRPPRDDVYCCLAMREDDPEGWASQQSRWRSTTPSSAQGESQQSHYSGVSAVEELAGWD